MIPIDHLLQCSSNIARPADKMPDSVGRPWVHDSKHMYGHRLRVAGVRFKDRGLVPRHKSGDVTTHYFASEIGSLFKASESVCSLGSHKSLAVATCEAERSSKCLILWW